MPSWEPLPDSALLRGIERLPRSSERERLPVVGIWGESVRMASGATDGSDDSPDGRSEPAVEET
jgi:hypothetical protein